MKNQQMVNWWKKLRYWQKGAIIGFCVGLVIFSFIFSNSLMNNPFFIFVFNIAHEVPRDIENALTDCSLCLESFISGTFLFLLQFVLIGAVVGFIIGKIREKSHP